MTAAPVTDQEIEKLENDIKVLKPLHNQLEIDRTKVVTRRDMQKKELKEMMETVQAIVPEWNGDPDELNNIVRKSYEVAKLQTDNCQAELQTAKSIIDPILKELE